MGRATRTRSVWASAFVAVTVVVGFMTSMPSASAAPFMGGFSPTIIGGGADLNGDGVVNGLDDSNEFYGSTSIINGGLDCNNWPPSTMNDGSAGDGVIDASDDCTLLGYDGTADGVTIQVTDGSFAWPTGTPLPTVFPRPLTPDDPSIANAVFAWSTIDGRVDSNGNERIDGADCHFGIIGGSDVLGSDLSCGFGFTVPSALDGLVDLNSDGDITAADSCTNGCFFGHDVSNGVVQGGGTVNVPTITSCTPSSGDVGTTVTVTGTNLGSATVRFGGVSATVSSNTSTQIVTSVPTGATSGPLTVTTVDGTASCSFTVTSAAHSRSITLRLRDSLVARGKVASDVAACVDSVGVKVQRRISGRWKTIRRTTTSSTGAYSSHLRDRHGRYRSVAPPTGTCARAVSPTRTH